MHRLALLALLLSATPAAAQLRPLPPGEWRGTGHIVACGAAHYTDIGVGLLGARGRLDSFGDCAAVADVGGARIQLSGVLRRAFTEDTSYAAPIPGVDRDGGPVRRDWGDFVLETLVPLGSGGGWVSGLRFGARFPTTDDRVGLERDRTDVHVVVMAGYEAPRLAGHAELGLGINGTHSGRQEQQDVLIYSGRVAYDLSGGVGLHAAAVGHVFWLNDYTHRGNENLGEVRAGVRVGDRLWAEVEGIVGYTDFSPSWGFRVRIGRAFGG